MSLNDQGNSIIHRTLKVPGDYVMIAYVLILHEKMVIEAQQMKFEEGCKRTIEDFKEDI